VRVELREIEEEGLEAERGRLAVPGEEDVEDVLGAQTDDEREDGRGIGLSCVF